MTYIEYERSQVIGVTAGRHETERARKENNQIDKALAAAKKQWVILPPENMTLSYQGLVVSIPHEIGRELVRRREAAILEHPVTVDVLIDGTIEEFVEVAA